ncbi:unnamed protein product, partial [Brassica oleracea var. botrytis]
FDFRVLKFSWTGSLILAWREVNSSPPYTSYVSTRW